MAFRKGSLWNEDNEIRCLAVMRRLQEENFPSGRHAQYARKLAAFTGIPEGSVRAKITNFKSLAGLIAPSNWSENSQAVWEKYGHLSADEIDALVR